MGGRGSSSSEGLALLVAARVDPAAMVRFFEVLKESGETPTLMQYFATHPRTTDRIRDLEVVAEREKGPFAPLLPGVPWDTVKRACPALPQPTGPST